MRVVFVVFVLLGATVTQAADFPIVMPKTSSSFLFEEAYNGQTGFSISQNDPSLADLFNKTVSPPASELCGPTTVANLMAFLKFNKRADNLALKYSPENPDYINQVREYFDKCKTSSTSGTPVVNLSECIADTFRESASSDFDVKVVGPEILPHLNPAFQTSPHTISVNDIRNAFKNNYAVILELKWYHVDESKSPPTWVTPNGHYILVVGYDYDASFGDSKIILKVVNPDVNYMVRDHFQRFDSIEMMKIPKKPGMSYPPGSDFILDGFNFKGYPNRAFVRFLIVSKPHAERRQGVPSR